VPRADYRRPWLIIGLYGFRDFWRIFAIFPSRHVSQPAMDFRGFQIGDGKKSREISGRVAATVTAAWFFLELPASIQLLLDAIPLINAGLTAAMTAPALPPAPTPR
jgi:hypothetical protein